MIERAQRIRPDFIVLAIIGDDALCQLSEPLRIDGAKA
jgi:hypothetical protein